jgi:hypothetical protein
MRYLVSVTVKDEQEKQFYKDFLLVDDLDSLEFLLSRSARDLQYVMRQHGQDNQQRRGG